TLTYGTRRSKSLIAPTGLRGPNLPSNSGTPPGTRLDRRDKGHHDNAMHYLCIGNTTRLGIARSM
ncbi:hypothetical protein ACNRC9_19295, partial [Ralstonia pseudosolanacearum]